MGSNNFSTDKVWERIWKPLCYGFMALILSVSVIHLFKADFVYDTDIARDMLLLQEMVDEGKPSLIGGRTSISGVFHGPLYYWLMVPIFVLSGGNPVVLSWVWYALYLIFIGAFYFIAKKVFDEQISLVSTAFLMSATFSLAEGFTHTVLANFLIIPLIYLVYKYSITHGFLWLIASVLVAGSLIQFQMAFGVPMVIILGGYTLFHILHQKRFSHLLAGLLLFVPVSTFVAFDLRHDFIQFSSVISTLSGENTNNFSLNGYWPDRWSSFVDTFRFWSFPIQEISHFMQISTILLLIFLTVKNMQRKGKSSVFIHLSMLVLFGFWLVTGPFKGNVWPQYYRTLVPVVILSASFAVLKYFPKKIVLPLFLLIVGGNTFFALQYGIKYLGHSDTVDEYHWKFYRRMAIDIMSHSEKKEFGYYIFTPDQFGYQAKYAMQYFAKSEGISVKPYSKQPLTYLLLAPYWDDNKFLSKEYWKNSQVKIDRDPDNLWMYRNSLGEESYSVMQFDLTDSETTVSAETTLVDGIHFR